MPSGEAVRNGHKCPKKRRWAFSGVCIFRWEGRAQRPFKGALRGTHKRSLNEVSGPDVGPAPTATETHSSPADKTVPIQPALPPMVTLGHNLSYFSQRGRSTWGIPPATYGQTGSRVCEGPITSGARLAGPTPVPSPNVSDVCEAVPTNADTGRDPAANVGNGSVRVCIPSLRILA